MVSKASLEAKNYNLQRFLAVYSVATGTVSLATALATRPSGSWTQAVELPSPARAAGHHAEHPDERRGRPGPDRQLGQGQRGELRRSAVQPGRELSAGPVVRLGGDRQLHLRRAVPLPERSAEDDRNDLVVPTGQAGRRQGSCRRRSSASSTFRRTSSWTIADRGGRLIRLAQGTRASLPTVARVSSSVRGLRPVGEVVHGGPARGEHPGGDEPRAWPARRPRSRSRRGGRFRRPPRGSARSRRPRSAPAAGARPAPSAGSPPGPAPARRSSRRAFFCLGIFPLFGLTLGVLGAVLGAHRPHPAS